MRGLINRPLLLASLLAVIAYLPALNNGFIADDYVILQRIGLMKLQPLYLLQVPPENFRFISYVVFGFLKTLAGYDARFFYAFNIGLHIANIALFRRLLTFVINDDFVERIAPILFAVFQAPQEAVMWLAAMNETTLAFFTFITLLMWWRKSYVIATAAYALALFSKESGVIILALIALLELKQRQRKPYYAYALLLIPTGLFAAIFFTTLSANFMITNRSYTLGPQAILVLLVSLHRLVWPWLYIVLVVAAVREAQARQRAALSGEAQARQRAALSDDRRESRSRDIAGGHRPPLQKLPLYLGCVVVPMLPYMFIAYQKSLPSRQLYLASAVLMTVFALLLKPLERTALLGIFMIPFVAFNVGYLWIRKDAQFEERAAPTTQLIAALGRHQPQPALVLNFAYPYPDIARAAALAVPGWRPELIRVDEPRERCENCLTLSWNAREKRYE